MTDDQILEAQMAAARQANPLSVPDDSYLQAYDQYNQQAAAQYAAEQNSGMLPPVAEIPTKKAVRKAKKVIEAVAAVAPVAPAVQVDNSIAAQMKNPRGMSYPDRTTMIPDWIRGLFRSNVDQNAASNTRFGNFANYTPTNRQGPLSTSRIPLP
jgi:hypothetical protein